ncbi:MAG: hypothetical protein MUO68_13440, partial [Desulfobacteraceae bacterium]|nr:hypothetical protein [Desulfobacteraceae bacterium]
FIKKFLYINEGTVPIEQGLLVKYGELVSKQEFLNKQISFSYIDAAKEIRAAGLKFMVVHEINLAIARVRKRLDLKDEHKDGKNGSRDAAIISLLEKIRQDNRTVGIPRDANDPAVLYRGTVDVATPALFVCFPFCMESLTQVADLNLEFFHVRFLLNFLARGLEKYLFACVVSHRIVGLIYLTLKHKILSKGLEIKFVSTVSSRTGDQTEPPYPAPKGVGTFLIAGTWMLWKTDLPSAKELSLDSEIAARGFYESIGFQPRGFAGYTLKSPKGHLLKAILMLANNCDDPPDNVFQEIRKGMEKQINGLRKKTRNKKETSARRAVIASVKECLKSKSDPELAETTLNMLRKYRHKIPESEDLINFATQ